MSEELDLAPEALDLANQDAYDDLLTAIEASEGQLSLLLAVCDDLGLRSAVIQRYEAELSPQFRAYRLTLARGEPSLKAAIWQTVSQEDYLQQGGRAVLTVTGIEQLSFLKLGEEKSEQDRFFGYLQWTREALRDFRFPIVIWLTYQTLHHLSRKSPDFWSWRKGVFRFATRIRAAIPAGELQIDRSLFGDDIDEDTLLPLADLKSLIQHTEQHNPKDPLLASLYAQMGRVYRDRLDDGKFQDYQAETTLAIEYLQKAIELQRELGQALDLASSLSKLAGLYRSQGRYEEAEPLYRQALDIARAHLGENHPDTAGSLNNLARLYQLQGRYEEAEPLHRQALDIARAQLGESHPSTATSLNNLAALYRSQGRYEEAEPLYRQALDIRRARLGENHLDTATSLNNLALLYESQGRYEQAEPLYLQALAIFMQTLGENHPNTQTSWENFVYFLQQVVEAGRAADLSEHPITQHVLAQSQTSP